MDARKMRFEAEVYEAVAQLQELFGNAHGDSVVCVALMNPALNVASPREVVSTVRNANLPTGELWTMFKNNGGVSKAGGGPNESEQHEPLRLVWEGLVSAPDKSAPRPR
eukprot:403268-Prymnesium_polylepis.1